MMDNGLQIHTVTPQIEYEWEQMVNEGIDLIKGKVVSAEIIDEVKMHLREYRREDRDDR